MRESLSKYDRRGELFCEAVQDILGEQFVYLFETRAR